jgi:hypothetical protein
MKSRSKELLERALAATVAAIEVYNKPDFLYREETFTVLAVNGWELLLKAKWLANNKNQARSLYVYEPITKKDGSRGKRKKIRLTRSGNPFTHSIDFLAKKLVESKHLEMTVWQNIEALLEIRDNAVHFYNHGNVFSIRLQEIGAASLRNFVTLVSEWFGNDLSEYNFYLMPLAFLSPPRNTRALILNKEEENFLKYVERLEKGEVKNDSRFSVAVNVEVKYTRSKATDAISYRLSNNPNAPEIRLTEQQILERYPLDYTRLTEECKNRYGDFAVDKKYHELRKQLRENQRYAMIRQLYPGNPKSAKTWYFSQSIFNVFDKHYQKSNHPV